MKAGVTEICGADIPKCDDTDEGKGAVAVAQAAICSGSSNTNWHKLFGSPPLKMFPPQKLAFTEACAPPPPPPPPPTVTTSGTTSGTAAASGTASTASNPSKVTLTLRASGTASPTIPTRRA